MMASSHLLGAGVSDNLGVPSVSLLSEDAVASESMRGKSWSVGGFLSTPEGRTSTLWKDFKVCTCYSGKPTDSPIS